MPPAVPFEYQDNMKAGTYWKLSLSFGQPYSLRRTESVLVLLSLLLFVIALYFLFTDSNDSYKVRSINSLANAPNCSLFRH
jgi:hypothetical protein